MPVPQLPVPPSIVVVASTMRSGSTLLKALLAEADDVLNLPETNFQNSTIVQNVLDQHQTTDPPIKVLKKPAWYHESKRYPILPSIENAKTIALVRDVYDTVVSLRKMTFRFFANIAAPFATSWLARNYWVNVTSRLIDLSKANPQSVKLVRYEDITAAPVATTKDLYSFIGSSRKDGTKTYSPPKNFSWRWGSDDGSENIKSLEVQPRRNKPQTDQRLLKIIENCQRIQAIRNALGYE